MLHITETMTSASPLRTAQQAVTLLSHAETDVTMAMPRSTVELSVSIHPSCRHRDMIFTTVAQEDASGSPEEGVRRAALVMGDPVAHLQAQAQVHLVGHAQSQADGCQRVGLGGADQALGELGGERKLHTPLWNLQGNTGRGAHLQTPANTNPLGQTPLLFTADAVAKGNGTLNSVSLLPASLPVISFIQPDGTKLQ